MESIIKHIENAELFSYVLSDGGIGIVIANSIEEAEEKVRDAYSKHGGYEDGKCGEDIYISELYQKPFNDAPDVLEIHG